MKPPRSAGAAVAVKSAIAGTIRPDVAMNMKVVADKTSASDNPDGKVVMNKTDTIVATASQRKTNSLPKRSASRPKYVSVTSVANPPAKYIHFNCSCRSPTLAVRYVGK